MTRKFVTRSKFFPPATNVELYFKPKHIIHHNQLLLTKFGKNLRHIKSTPSRVQPAANSSTDDVKMTSKVQPPLLNRWPRKPGDEIAQLCEQKSKEQNCETPLRTGKVFWINNKAIIEFGFSRIWIILQISGSVIHLAIASVDNTLLDLQNSSYPTQSRSIIAKCFKRFHKI